MKNKSALELALAHAEEIIMISIPSKEHVCHFAITRLWKGGVCISTHVGDSRTTKAKRIDGICCPLEGTEEYFKTIKVINLYCKSKNIAEGLKINYREEYTILRRRKTPAPAKVLAQPATQAAAKEEKKGKRIADMRFSPETYTCRNCGRSIHWDSYCKVCT